MRATFLLIQIFLLAFLHSGLESKAQLPKTVRIYNPESGESSLFSKALSDSLATTKEMQSIILGYRETGFLEANLDQVLVGNDSIVAIIHKGKRYKFAKLALDSVPKGILNQLGISAKDWEDKSLSPKKIVGLMEQILGYADEHGYPFASVGLDNLKWDEKNGLYANLQYKQGYKVIIDTIEVRGTAVVDSKFLLAYLGLKNKMLYNEKALSSISLKISELSFLKESAPWQMLFSVVDNKLLLFLEDKKSNQINALIGFQPTNQETNRFLWTADVQLLLNNTLGYGETFSASYKNLQPKSPQLDVNAIMPYIGGSKIGVDVKFEYYARDTLFNRTTVAAGLRYQLAEKDFLRIGFQQVVNRVPSPDTIFVKQNKRLSDNVDLRSRGVVASYALDKTDFSFNPRKGWTATASVAVMNRKIQKSQAVLAINDGYPYEKLYDTVNNNPTQIRIEASAQYFIPLARLISLQLAYQGAYISGKSLFQNELYQIGGFKTLRGFDERAIFANQYHIGTLGLKTILSQRSYFNIFTDYGKVFTQYNLVNKVSMPLSFGAGLTLENTAGIFNIVLALGKNDGEKFEFKNAKVHFGYVTYF